MTKPYQEILLELVDAVRDQCEDNCIAFELFVNYESYTFQFKNTKAGSLKSRGISMRNLKGKYIVESDNEK